MVKIRFVGPEDSRELPDGRVVLRNHQVEVDEALAGRQPDARREKVMADIAAAQSPQDHQRRSELVAELTTLDLGEGLLAQESWAPVSKKDEVDK